MNLEIIVYTLQILLAVGAFFISIYLLIKNARNLGNRLLSASLALVGIYSILLFLYKFLNSVVLLYWSIKIGFSALLFAVYLLFCTMQVLTHSSHVFETKRFRYISWLIVAGIISGLMFFMDWILVEGDDISTLEYDFLVFLPFAGYIAFMLIYSMMHLYRFGIKKISGEARKYLWRFFLGLSFMVMALLTEGLGGIFDGLALLFDVLLFLFLTIGVFFMSLSLLRNKN